MICPYSKEILLFYFHGVRTVNCMFEVDVRSWL